MKRILFLLSLIFLAACSQPAEQKAQPAATKPAPTPLEAITTEPETPSLVVFQDPVRHYHLMHPKNWRRQPTQDAMVFMSPKETAGDGFQENVSLILQDLSRQNLTLDEFIDVSRYQLQRTKEANITAIRDTSVHGIRAKIIETDLLNKGNPLKLKQLCLLRGKIMYIFTYTAEPGSYHTFEPTASRIMGSFEFEK